MSRKDDITNKGPLTGNHRSHAMNHSRRVWNLNLQTVEIKDGPHKTKKVRVSARTLKSLKKHNQLA